MAGATVQAAQTERGSVAHGSLGQATQRTNGRTPITAQTAAIALFRGQVIGAKVASIAKLPVVTLDLEDYNRLLPRIAVGAPNGFVYTPQPDGTVLAVELAAYSRPIASLMGAYWPSAYPLDVAYGHRAPDPPSSPALERFTACTDLDAYMSELAARVGGAVRHWIDPDLVLWWADLATSTLDPAPYELNNDAAESGTSIMANMEVSWDFAAKRSSIYIRGGTPAPYGSGYAGGVQGGQYGTAYVDAPGCLTPDDRDVVGAWHLAHDFRALLTGTAKVRPGLDGWRVGQAISVTDSVLGRLTGHPLDHHSSVIQSVRGHLVAPAEDRVGSRLRIAVADIDITRRIDWRSFAFEQTLGSAGKATLVFSLVDDGDLEIGELADVLIVSESAPIEYDLEFGDAPAGSLAREAAKEAAPQTQPPAYRFDVSTPDYPNLTTMPVGASCLAIAQAMDMTSVGYPLSALPVEWFILQWADAAETTPAAAYSLAGTQASDGGWGGNPTDGSGKAFQTITRDTGDTVDHLSILATAVPIV